MTTKAELKGMLSKLKTQVARLQARADRQTMRAAWYRAKLLGFVTTKWIKQEKAKDGV